MRLLLLALLFSLTPARADDWITSWGAAPDQAGPSMQMTTLRQTVRLSAGGSALRLRLSNLFGTAPLTIGPVRAGDGDVTFDGKPSVTIPPGQSALSDALPMKVKALQELVVTLHVTENRGPSTVHGEGKQTVHILHDQDGGSETDDSRYFLTDVEVLAGGDAYTIVAIGDSITDGVGSTPDRNRRWPDRLAEQLNREAAVGVVNSGIAGNRILHDAAKPFVGPSVLSRFDKDALSKPGARWIVLLSGGNDLNANEMLDDPAQKVTAAEIIAGLQTLVRRAHDHGIRICGGTLLPKAGVRKPFKYTLAAEAGRQEVNAWIRQSGAFDTVADFDQALRDPMAPDHLLAAFDSGDHLHPNDHGYEAMAAVAYACVR